MPQVLKALKKDNKGATAIESAFVAPVLFLLIFGILEFGLMLTTQSSLEGAATAAARDYKAAAREGNVGADIGAIHDLIIHHGHGLIDPANLRVTALELSSGWGGAEMADDVDEDAGVAGTVGQIIQYQLFYDYSFYTPVLSNLLAEDNGMILLRASTVVQNEPKIGG